MDKQENQRLLRKLIVVALVMFAFGFALVPFYEKICEVTGINSLMKADAVENTQVDRTRLLRVSFDANVRDQLPVRLIAPREVMQVHPGQLYHLEYLIENTSQQRQKVQAIPAYAPLQAAAHFKKLECFCFNQQTLEPGEKRKLPVVFIVDATLPAEVIDLTLSYTLFRVAGSN